MWAIRAISGPQSGQIYPLKKGRNLLGRTTLCDVKLANSGVSKEHCEITVMKDKLIITDLKSSNGTYVNGVRIQNAALHKGDRFGINEAIFEVIPAPQQPKAPEYLTSSKFVNRETQHPQLHETHSQQFLDDDIITDSDPPPPTSKNLMHRLSDYLDKVALPGIYKLSEVFEYKYDLVGFVALFIITATLLSMIPMIRITREGILTESKRRATSLARTLGTLNQNSIMQDTNASLSIHSVDNEEGVVKVYIVRQSDGAVLAPASLAGTIPDLPFLHSARKEIRPITSEIDSTTIGASFPIGGYDSNSGEQTIKALAIVLYDVASLSLDDGRLISLFFESLFLAMILASVIFFFLYRLIEYPFSNLNTQLDICLRDKRDNIEIPFKFPALQSLLSNINSLLSRTLSSDGTTPLGLNGVNKHGEAENLVRLIGYPCVAISDDNRIITANPMFAQIARLELPKLIGQGLQIIPDLAFQQNLEGLLNKTRDTSNTIHSDQLEFGGHSFLLSCAAVISNKSQIEYFLISISPQEGGE